MKTVGAYEAKTHLPSPFKDIGAGDAFTSTNDEVPVAWPVPATDESAHPIAEVIDELKESRPVRKWDGQFAN